MARCPRCASSALPYSRCDRCGLMLGFDGLTILIDFHDTPAFQRVRNLALQQASCSEWTREDGSRYLHVTYSFSEVDRFNRLASAAARLSGKRAFVNGLEIPWPTVFDAAAFSAELVAPSRPRSKSPLASVPG